MEKPTILSWLVVSTFLLASLLAACDNSVTTTPVLAAKSTVSSTAIAVTSTVTPPPAFTVASGIPELAVKPMPALTVFHNCPPQGDEAGTKEAEANRFGNRVDEGNYIPVSLDAVLSLSWPKAPLNIRDQWSAADAAAVSKYEGLPLSIEGYLISVQIKHTEGTNCKVQGDPAMNDFQLELIKTAGQAADHAMVVEVTPRLLDKNPGWQLGVLRELVQTERRVRISGWLFLDDESTNDQGRTTPWELHPVMKIEVWEPGQWREVK